MSKPLMQLLIFDFHRPWWQQLSFFKGHWVNCFFKFMYVKHFARVTLLQFPTLPYKSYYKERVWRLWIFLELSTGYYNIIETYNNIETKKRILKQKVKFSDSASLSKIYIRTTRYMLFEVFFGNLAINSLLMRTKKPEDFI